MHYLLTLWISNFLTKSLPGCVDVSKHRAYTTLYEDLCM